MNHTNTSGQIQPKKKRGWIVFALGCGFVLLFILLIAGVYLYAGWLGYQEAPKIIDVQESGAQHQDPYTLSPGQEEQLFAYGYPEAFTILFYEEETIDGGVAPVRLET